SSGQHPAEALTAEGVPGLLPPEIGRAVLALAAAEGAETEAVARAVAVLGARPAPTNLVVAVAGLLEAAAEDAMHTLAGLGLLTRVEDEVALASPAVARTVADAIRPSHRQELHARAARHLLAAGAPVTEAAEHLVHAPLGLPGTAEVLQRAATDAVRQ